MRATPSVVQKKLPANDSFTLSPLFLHHDLIIPETIPGFTRGWTRFGEKSFPTWNQVVIQPLKNA